MNPVVTVLATQRLTQLVTEDELTRPFREGVNRWAGNAAEFSFKDRVATLVMCPACMSVWSGAGILLASRFRVGRVLVRVLAASGAALIVNAGIKRVER
jgi:hypothetical protein